MDSRLWTPDCRLFLMQFHVIITLVAVISVASALQHSHNNPKASVPKSNIHPDKAIEARMAAMDADSTARMKRIVQRYGWPGPDLVGRDGADAAFLFVQHSPDLAFQRAMLPLVRKSYESGKLSAWSYALLLDRVLTREGKPQVYGMAVNRWSGKGPVLYPIEDEPNVDKRRAKIGLPPLREYLETLKRQYFPGP